MKLEAMNTVTIGWDKGDKFAEIDLPAGHRLNNRLKKLHDERPEDFERFVQNPDGTLYALIPIEWVKVGPPRRVVMTEERKRASAEALERAREAKRSATMH